MTSAPATVSTSPLRNPWVQLAAGVVCMAMIANLQYGWTVFVDPIGKQNGWGRAAIQVSFTIFVLLETWLVPFEALLVDKYGPRLMVAIGGVLCGFAWFLDSTATTLPMLYLAGAVAGIGAGMVYGTCVGNALKWFGSKRGLAAGLTAAGFGAGSALTVVPLINMIASSGYQHTFLVFGIIQGAVVVIASLFLVRPPATKPAEAPPSTKVIQGTRDYAPTEVLKSPVFYVMYVMFVLVATGGLTAVAQLAPIAKDFYIDGIPVSILGLTMPALTFALSIDRVMNGVTRPVMGYISDRVGRENTMFVAFLLEGIGIFALMKFGTSPIAFVILSGCVFFAWGEIYSIFPATTRDHYGQKFATTNYGMLYTAKGTAALLVPLSSIVTTATGSWNATLMIAAAFNIVAAILAIAVLKPMRRRDILKQRESLGTPIIAGLSTAS
jgi:OFA family oxalate/formate antiporter-like MFS transporter